MASLSSSDQSARRMSEDDEKVLMLQLEKELEPSNVSVLVVDDDKTIRTVLERNLRDMHYQVTSVEGGLQAQKILKQKQFQVLLVDVFMPGVDGYELLRFMKQAYTQDIAIIMMSGSEDPETVSKAFQGGAEDFLQKPIRVEVLKKRIEAALQDRLRKRREKFLSAKNQKLEEQLQKKQEEIEQLKNQVSEAIETPIQVVMNTVGELTRGSYTADEYRTALFAVLKSLGSSDLYRPAFSKILNSAPAGQIDQTTRQWLFSEFTHDREEVDSKAPAVQQKSGVMDADGSPQSADRPILSATEFISPAVLSPPGAIHVAPTEPIGTSGVAKETQHPSGIPPWSTDDLPREFTENIRKFSFDTLSHTPDQLIKGVIFMFKEFNLFETFKIDVQKFWNFLHRAQASYHNNPYHNFMHAMDVTQFAFTCLSNPDVSKYLHPMDILALLLSAMCHDMDHPGLNNNFQVNVQSKIALVYNDISVLENHHSSYAFQLLRDPHYNVLENLSASEYKELRRLMVNAVLATDMANHFEFVSKFQTRISANPLSRESKDDRQMIISIILKCSDISNASRPFEVALKWSDNLIAEFCSQGDLEKAKGMPISPFMDRESMDQVRMQVNFIDFVAGPLFKAFIEAFKFQTLADTIAVNRAVWGDKLAQQAAAQAAAAAAGLPPPSTLPASAASSGKPPAHPTGSGPAPTAAPVPSPTVTPPAPAAPAGPALVAYQPKKVLVADGDMKNLARIKEYLTKRNPDKDRPEGVARCEPQFVDSVAGIQQVMKSTQLDALVLGTALRGADGLAIGAEIRKQLPNLPMIGMGPADLKDRALKSGFDDFVSPSVSFEAMCAAIIRALYNRAIALGVVTPSTAKPTEEPVDLATALEQSGGDESFLDDLLSEFVEMAVTQIEEMEQHMISGDMVVLHRVAHSLKGAALTLAANPLGHSALVLEQAAKPFVCPKEPEKAAKWVPPEATYRPFYPPMLEDIRNRLAELRAFLNK